MKTEEYYKKLKQDGLSFIPAKYREEWNELYFNGYSYRAHDLSFLCDKYKGLTFSFEDVDDIELSINSSIERHLYTFRKTFEAMNLEYNPLYNVDGTERVTYSDVERTNNYGADKTTTSYGATTSTTNIGERNEELTTGARSETSNIGARSSTNNIGARSTTNNIGERTTTNNIGNRTTTNNIGGTSSSTNEGAQTNTSIQTTINGHEGIGSSAFANADKTSTDSSSVLGAKLTTNTSEARVDSTTNSAATDTTVNASAVDTSSSASAVDSTSSAAAVDSVSSAEATDKSKSSAATDSTQISAHSDTASRDARVDKEVTKSHTVTTERFGNIGVTKSTDLIMSYYEAVAFSFLDFVFSTILKDVTEYVY